MPDEETTKGPVTMESPGTGEYIYEASGLGKTDILAGIPAPARPSKWKHQDILGLSPDIQVMTRVGVVGLIRQSLI